LTQTKSQFTLFGRDTPHDVMQLVYRMARRGRPLRYLGKLGLKEEPAGKVRVFAMVDCFTQ